MELAPKPKPTTTLGSLKRIVQSRMPSIPIPTTFMPITVPPVKATVSAWFIPFVALKAVFPFAFVATFIPK